MQCAFNLELLLSLLIK